MVPGRHRVFAALYRARSIVARLFRPAASIRSRISSIGALRMPPSARDYWDDQWMQTLIRPRAVARSSHTTRLKAAPVRSFKCRPKEINIVVVGRDPGAWKCSAPTT